MKLTKQAKLIIIIAVISVVLIFDLTCIGIYFVRSHNTNEQDVSMQDSDSPNDSEIYYDYDNYEVPESEKISVIYQTIDPVKSIPQNATAIDFLGLQFKHIRKVYPGDLEFFYSEDNNTVCVFIQNCPFLFELTPNSPPEDNSVIVGVELSSDNIIKEIPITNKILSNIKFSDLERYPSGVRWINSLYTYTIKVNGVYVDFAYFNIPDKNSIAEHIYISRRDTMPTAQAWSSDTQQESQATEATSILYQEVINEYKNKHNASHSIWCYCSWAKYDINHDGVAELIVQEEDGEADRMHYVYTIKDSSVVKLGEYEAWHTALFTDNSKLSKVVTNPNYAWEVYEISINANSLNLTKIKEIEKTEDLSYHNELKFQSLNTPV